MGYTAGVTAVDRKVYPNHDRMTEIRLKTWLPPGSRVCPPLENKFWSVYPALVMYLRHGPFKRSSCIGPWW